MDSAGQRRDPKTEANPAALAAAVAAITHSRTYMGDPDGHPVLELGDVDGRMVAHALIAIAVHALNEIDRLGGDSTAMLQYIGAQAARWEARE